MDKVPSEFLKKQSKEHAMLVACVLFYPFFLKFSLLLLVFYLIISEWPFKFRKIDLKAVSMVPLATLTLYFIYAVSLLNTQNIEHGFRDLETKFGLLIFPLLMIYFPRNNQAREVFMLAFIASFCLVSLVCLGNSCYHYVFSGDFQSFYYDSFSFLMHPTYFTMHLTMALLFFLHFFTMSSTQRNWKAGLFGYFVILILTGSIFLSSSRAGIVIGFLIAVIFLILKLFNHKPKALNDLAVFITLLAGIVLLLSPVNSRFDILKKEITNSDMSGAGMDSITVDTSPISHRVMLYESALRVATRNPLGVGVGDVQSELVSEYERIGYEKAVVMRYNPHNQYLQTAVATGLPGLILLLAMFLFLFRRFVSNGSFTMPFVLGLVLMLNSLFESILEVERGVLFYAIMIFFLDSSEKSVKN